MAQVHCPHVHCTFEVVRTRAKTGLTREREKGAFFGDSSNPKQSKTCTVESICSTSYIQKIDLCQLSLSMNIHSDGWHKNGLQMGVAPSYRTENTCFVFFNHPGHGFWEKPWVFGVFQFPRRAT